jgi:esterase FrsA
MSYEYPVDVKGLWSKLADQYARSGQSFRAIPAYGGARFPCLADQAKVTAHQHQLEQYVQAAKDFPVAFERRVVSAKYQGGVVEVPVHILSETGATKDTPVLVVTGGVDTFKMDLHQMWVTYVLGAHVRVVAADIPGTGEHRRSAVRHARHHRQRVRVHRGPQRPAADRGHRQVHA